MDGVKFEDPFQWDVEVVVERLCSGTPGWTKDADALASHIREEEIDGKTLLTYEKTCSRQELMECLGVRLARHKAALAELIVGLRCRSKAFQDWWRTFQKQQNLEEASQDDSNHLATNHRPSVETAQRQSPQPAAPSAKQDNTMDVDKPAQAPPSPESGGHLENGSTSIKDTTQPEVSGQPLKRKRIAPMNLTTTPVHATSSVIPSEADHFLRRSTPNGLAVRTMMQDVNVANAYIGEGSLIKENVLSSEEVSSSSMVDLGEGSFTIVPPHGIPHGARMIIHQAVKGLLRRNGEREAMLNSGLVPMASPSLTSSDDRILDLVDLPDEFDEQTLQEMEEEALEMDRLEELQAKKYLSQEQVQSTLDRAIQDMKQEWRDTKLPKHEQRRYKIWMDSRRRGNTRRAGREEAERWAKRLDARIKGQREKIMETTWLSEREVINQARCIEPSLFDKLYQHWIIETLELREAPPRLAKPYRPKPVERKPRDELSDGESLGSGDEGFIVPDEEIEEQAGLQHASDDEFPVTPRRPPRASQLWPAMTKDSIMIDLTDSPNANEIPVSQRQQDIDSSPPVSSPLKKEKQHGEKLPLGEQPVPDVSDYRPLDKIGSVNPNKWRDGPKKDRWKYAICLLWHLPHERRQAVLDLVSQDSTEDIWAESVGKEIAMPLRDSSSLKATKDVVAAFDMTRIFYSFVRIREVQEKRMEKMTAKDERKLIEARRPWFNPFCDFFRHLAPEFPQESQIFRDDDVDEQTDDDLMETDGMPPETRTPSSAKHREIVRDKEGVDMRAKARIAAEEQDARRQLLRQRLALGSISGAQTRLIINEAKEDHHGFVYVHEEIGNRIKKHQVEGVRFMWNQLVTDPELRQGCLLAHTMGLGKSMQVITFLVALSEAANSTDASVRSQIPEDLRSPKILVLCPAGLVHNWIDEFLIWAPENLLGQLRHVAADTVVSERYNLLESWKSEGGVLVIGYNLFQKMVDRYPDTLKEVPDIVVADEAHKLKNPGASITKTCSELRTKTRIALTGSPLANNVDEYHAMINWVAPNFLGPLDEFREIYGRPIDNGLYTDSVPSERRKAIKMLQVLKETVAPKIHRRTINSSLKNEFSPKLEFVISVPATEMQQRVYNLLIDDIRDSEVGSIKQARLFGIVTNLRLICNHPHCFRSKIAEDAKNPKADGALSPRMIDLALKEMNTRDPINPSLSNKVTMLMGILDEARALGDKVLIFSQSIPTVEYLANLFRWQKRSFLRLDGNTQISKRQDNVKAFNSGTYELYLISTTAGGVGLNLQGANRVVIFDLAWNPVDEQQAIGRSWRIGQTKPVSVYRFVVAGSFEEVLQSKAVFKTQLFSRVVDKKNPISWSKRLKAMVHHLKQATQTDISGFKGQDTILDKLIEGTPIRSIVSSDTFEQEDPTDALTAEERQEAAQMVKRNKLRLTDPKKFEELQRSEMQQAAERQLQSRQLQTATPNATLLAQLPPRRNYAWLEGNYERQPGPRPVATRPAQTATPVQPVINGHAPNLIQPPGLVGAHPAPAGSAQPMTQGLAFTSSQAAPGTPPLFQNGSAVQRAPDVQPGTGNQMVQGSQHQAHQSPSLPNRPNFPQQAPPPIPGTGTHWPHPANVAAFHPQQRASPPILVSMANTPTAASNGSKTKLFGQSLQNTGKTDFIDKLQSRARSCGIRAKPGEGLVDMAYQIANEIERIRRDVVKAGYVPDEHHWRLLCEYLYHDRFVLGLTHGHLAIPFLATAQKKDFEQRISALNSLAEPAFRRILSEGPRPPDPKNLENIKRSRSVPASPGSVAYVKSTADAKVMRSTADNRRHRHGRLPVWASEALSPSTSTPTTPALPEAPLQGSLQYSNVAGNYFGFGKLKLQKG